MVCGVCRSDGWRRARDTGRGRGAEKGKEGLSARCEKF